MARADFLPDNGLIRAVTSRPARVFATLAVSTQLSCGRPGPGPEAIATPNPIVSSDTRIVVEGDRPPRTSITERDYIIGMPTVLEPDRKERLYQNSRAILEESYQVSEGFRRQVQATGDRSIPSDAKDYTFRLVQFSEAWNLGLARTENSTVVVNGKYYNLDNPTEYVLSTTLIRGLVSRAGLQESNLFRAFLWEDIPAIESLRGKVVFQPDSNLFASSRQLADLGRSLQTLTEAGNPVPTRWRLGGYVYDSSTDMAGLDAGDPYRSLISYYSSKNPNLFPTFAATFGNIPADGKDREILESKYRESFVKFMDKGTELRAEIAFLEAIKSPEAAALRTQYNIFKFAFNVETTVRGTRSDEVKPEVGQVYTVRDLDLTKPGIFLKPEPRPDLNPSWPVTYHGQRVMVLDGPVQILDHEKRTAYDYWLVQRGEEESRGEIKVWITNPGRPKGWVAGSWLAEKAVAGSI